jgi:ubiquinone biosynthesis protein UbiJ
MESAVPKAPNPFFTFPAFPAGLLSQALTRLVCLVFNHLLAQQVASKNRLQKDSGKVVCIQVEPITLVFRVDEQGYFQSANAANGLEVIPTTEISMDWADLIGGVSTPSKMSRKAKIEGDMDFAQVVSSVLNDLSWDPERDLARIVGDTQAVWIMKALTGVGTNLKDLLARFKNNLREYVVHEQSISPSVSELDAFTREMSVLRDQVARLEKRLKKLDGGGFTA